MSNFSTQQDAQKYVDKQCDTFFGIDQTKKREFEIRDDGGCYLTTATVDYLNLADDCEELTILRNFRDNYLAKLPNGKKEIKHYYSIAPVIVNKINFSKNKEEILNNIYNQLIIPCVELIKQGQLKETYQKYKEYTLKLEQNLLAPKNKEKLTKSK
ncbi:CFI-box-CTERM domain-containing protein [Streptococcus mutans]|uniref:CFI-box-CTERM domain-containing protein n=1 Tax=Streptococcus mutans TaxID=1309 RepID=UPI00298A4FE6|nr:CFI-box-CTERM domain-containing protein [Streptococcus mutans]MDW5556081.1 CFI-box-CTERM domain-containing protein [Streptococcus mutans]